MRIAVFDNDESIVDTIGLALNHSTKYKLVLFEETRSGLEYLGLLDDSLPDDIIDLFLINIDSNKNEALQLLKTLRSHEDFFDIPVIVITKEGDIEILETAFKNGANDFIFKPLRNIELKSRIQSSLRLKKANDHWKEKERELLETNRLLMVANQNYLQLTSLDGLTGITNRATFDKIFELEWRRARRNQSNISLAVIDVDYFKQYNDNYGHPAGDDALRRVADALERSISKSGDLVARYGGEEFVALLPDTNYRGAKLVAQLIMRNVTELAIGHKYSEISNVVTVSIGIAMVIPAEKEPSRSLLEKADKMLYAAKNGGRNQIRIYED